MRGLHVRVFPNGRKTARFQYILNGKRYRMVLGHFPTDSAKKLRDLYGEARTERSKGIDLVQQRKRVVEEDAVRKKEAIRLKQIEENSSDYFTEFELIQAIWEEGNRDTAIRKCRNLVLRNEIPDIIQETRKIHIFGFPV